nr:serine hydrolase [Lacimicrobium alkaliphilum]
MRSETNTPGIGVSLLQADGNLWFHGSGFANLKKHTRINQDTQFRFSSVSKMLVSLSVLKLVDQGVLKLDDKVAELADSFLRLIPWPLRVTENSTQLSVPFAGPERRLIADATNGFKQQSTGKVVLVKTEDPVAGEVLHYGPHTLKKVSLLSAYLPRIVLLLWLADISEPDYCTLPVITGAGWCQAMGLMPSAQ